ncbi:MAG: hypothetical protein HUU55_19860 [Myxococcales bacterium]|nr:hypothetical protein [Myxococcales bacterium]
MDRTFRISLLTVFLPALVPTMGTAAPIFSDEGALLPPSACGIPHGDLDGSGIVDVTDVQCSLLTALEALAHPDNPTTPSCLADTFESANVNCADNVDVSDISLVVTIAIGSTLSPELDSDANGCPDTCDAVTIPPTVPEFGGAGGVNIKVIGTATHKLSVVRDLAFNPQFPNQLWAFNRATDSTTIFFNPDTPQQTWEWRKDGFGNHFMEEVSSAAFGVNNTFATCQESQNTYDGQAAPNNFMGPALWPGDLSVYAKVNQTYIPPKYLLGSHLDMLHWSPLCMGIAHDKNNVYWVFDGYHGYIVRYDFGVPHGYGEDDHSDGIIRTYPMALVKRVAGIPSHMELDKTTGWLYVADTGNKRIFRLNTTTGTVKQAMPVSSWNEPLKEFSIMQNSTVQMLVTTGLTQPSGLALSDNRIFVSDYFNGDIFVYSTTGALLDRLKTGASGVTGLTFGPDGRLWYTNPKTNTVSVLNPVNS